MGPPHRIYRSLVFKYPEAAVEPNSRKEQNDDSGISIECPVIVQAVIFGSRESSPQELLSSKTSAGQPLRSAWITISEGPLEHGSDRGFLPRHGGSTFVGFPTPYPPYVCKSNVVQFESSCEESVVGGEASLSSTNNGADNSVFALQEGFIKGLVQKLVRKYNSKVPSAEPSDPWAFYVSCGLSEEKAKVLLGPSRTFAVNDNRSEEGTNDELLLARSFAAFVLRTIASMLSE